MLVENFEPFHYIGFGVRYGRVNGDVSGTSYPGDFSFKDDFGDGYGDGDGKGGIHIVEEVFQIVSIYGLRNF